MPHGGIYHVHSIRYRAYLFLARWTVVGIIWVWELKQAIYKCINFFGADWSFRWWNGSCFWQILENTLPKYFPDLRIRKYFGNVDFVSPSNGFDFDSSETPNEHNIVTKSHLTINNRNWEKLFFDIWDAFARIASLLRSTRKLTSEQQKDLLEDTRNFASVYTTNSSCRWENIYPISWVAFPGEARSQWCKIYNCQRWIVI